MYVNNLGEIRKVSLNTFWYHIRVEISHMSRFFLFFILINSESLGLSVYIYKEFNDGFKLINKLNLYFL